jgi:hypothetical protein
MAAELRRENMKTESLLDDNKEKELVKNYLNDPMGFITNLMKNVEFSSLLSVEELMHRLKIAVENLKTVKTNIDNLKDLQPTQKSEKFAELGTQIMQALTTINEEHQQIVSLTDNAKNDYSNICVTMFTACKNERIPRDKMPDLLNVIVYERLTSEIPVVLVGHLLTDDKIKNDKRKKYLEKIIAKVHSATEYDMLKRILWSLKTNKDRIEDDSVREIMKSGVKFALEKIIDLVDRTQRVDSLFNEDMNLLPSELISAFMFRPAKQNSDIENAMNWFALQLLSNRNPKFLDELRAPANIPKFIDIIEHCNGTSTNSQKARDNALKILTDVLLSQKDFNAVIKDVSKESIVKLMILLRSVDEQKYGSQLEKIMKLTVKFIQAGLDSKLSIEDITKDNKILINDKEERTFLFKLLDTNDYKHALEMLQQTGTVMSEKDVKEIRVHVNANKETSPPGRDALLKHLDSLDSQIKERKELDETREVKPTPVIVPKQPSSKWKYLLNLFNNAITSRKEEDNKPSSDQPPL